MNDERRERAEPVPDESEVIARVALAAAAEPGDAKVAELVARHGPAGAVRRFGRLGRTRVPDLAAAEAEVERVRALGVRLVPPATPGWPTQLDQLEVPPLLLWVRGVTSLREHVVRSVAVVGARAATAYGRRVAEGLGADLAARGYCIVSGGAYGIDAAAHRGALAVGGFTVAVLACGVDVAYPHGNEALFEQVLHNGALVSEVPLGAEPRRGRFLVRNRVIAALTIGTVVVEAARRSGALNTAAEANTLNRPVLGVPGPVDSHTSAGVHRLLRQYAVVVTDADDVETELGGFDDVAADGAPGLLRPRDRLSELARILLEEFPAHTALSASELAGLAGVASASVPPVLAELAAAGMIRNEDDCWRLTAKARA